MANLRKLRNRVIDLEGSLERGGTSSIDNGSACLLVQTTVETSYPTTADAVYYCKILRVGGDPVEGGAATFTDTGKRIYALNAGSRVPPIGTKLIATYGDGHWMIAYA